MNIASKIQSINCYYLLLFVYIILLYILLCYVGERNSRCLKHSCILQHRIPLHHHSYHIWDHQKSNSILLFFAIVNLIICPQSWNACSIIILLVLSSSAAQMSFLISILLQLLQLSSELSLQLFLLSHFQFNSQGMGQEGASQ